jgi:hypothetical protein
MLSATGCLQLKVNQIESNNTDLIAHGKVPSTLVEVLEEIFKEMEEQYQMHTVKIAVMTTVM